MKKNGFVAISVVLILIVVILSIGTTVTYLSIGEGQSGLILFQGEHNLSFVEGCTEEVLFKVRGNSTYNASTISRPEGTCSITYTSGGPTNWDITVSSPASAEAQRKVRVIFTRSDTGITLTSWKEV